MPDMSAGETTTHTNDEQEVHCPATYPDGSVCNETVLARGLHLHVLRKDDAAHGPQGERPGDITLERAEPAGTREVSLDYPTDRATENVARQCPYCGVPFRGKQGLAIHFGQVVGRKNHPADRDEFPDPTECPVVRLDDDENIVEVVDAGAQMPSARQRTPTDLDAFLAQLRAEGRADEAEAVEDALGR